MAALKKIENIQGKCRSSASVTLICDFAVTGLYYGHLWKNVLTFPLG